MTDGVTRQESRAASPLLRARHAADADREAQILDAVLEMFSEKGYEGLTVDALARRVHASKATIYGRWGGKKPLLLHAVRHLIDPVDDVDTGNLRDDLVALGRAVDLSKGRSAGLMLAIGHIASVDPEFARSIQDNLAAPFRAAMAGVVSRAVHRGELPVAAMDLEYVADVLPSLALGRRLFGATAAISVADVVDTIVLPALRNAHATVPPGTSS